MLQGEHSAILLTFIKIFVCLFLSGNFTQVLLYLHLLPIAGLFTIKFNGYQIPEVNKNNFPIDQPILVKHGRVRGNKNIFNVGLSLNICFGCLKEPSN